MFHFGKQPAFNLLALLLLSAGAAGAAEPLVQRVDESYCFTSATSGGQTEASPTAVDPIYIGGMRYRISTAQMTPLYRYYRAHPPRQDADWVCFRRHLGYRLQLPVSGDAGQPLFFDINGRSDSSVTLNVSCGSFSGSDQGNKFLISGQMVTGGSCRTFDLELKNSNAVATAELTVMISEQL